MKLVSAILVTRGRQEWAAQALHCFETQTYPYRELIVIDDADDPSFPQGLTAPHMCYIALPTRQTIPAKRNEACRYANGDIIWTLDSDDWSAPERMAEQVNVLEASGKAMTAYHSMLFYVEPTRQVVKYYGLPHYGIGTSLCYRRAWWKDHLFREELIEGEDNKAVALAHDEQQFLSSDAGERMVARIHPGNTSYKNLQGLEYRPVSLAFLPKGFIA